MNFWFFSFAHNKISLQAKYEADGIMGDCFDELGPGETFHGLSFDELKNYGSGKIRVENGRGAIIN